MSSIVLAENYGSSVVINDVPYTLIGTVNQIPTDSVDVGDITYIEEYTWAYDDDDVVSGTNHRTWTSQQMATAQRFNHNRPHAELTVNTTKSYCYIAPYAGVLRIWQLDVNPGVAFSVYVNDALANTARVCYGQANAIPVKVLKNDMISIIGGTNYNITMMFMPYERPYVGPSIPVRDLRVQLSTMTMNGNTIINDTKWTNTYLQLVSTISIVDGRNGRKALNIDASGELSYLVPAANNNATPSAYYTYKWDQRYYDFTYSAWVKRESGSSWSGRIFYTSNQSGATTSIWVNDGRVLAASMNYSSDTVGKATTSAISSFSEWVHIAVIMKAPFYNGPGQFKLYANGQLIPDSQCTLYNTYRGEMANYPTNNLYIGANGGTDGLYGQIQDILLYSRALTDEEILQIYNYQLNN